MKQCSKCKETKDFSEFFKSAGKPDGYQAYCKPCKRGHERDTHSYADNRKHMLWSKYKMTPAQYEDMLKAQGYACANKGCGATDPARGQIGFSVDHDHACCGGDKSCGECVRGLLCNKCNVALGLVNDDPAVLQGLVDYLAGSG